MTVTLEDGKTLDAELLLVAVGRGPVSAGLGYEEAGRRDGPRLRHRRRVLPDQRARPSPRSATSSPTLQLAHVGFAEGILVAERSAGCNSTPIDYDGVPRITYCDPEVASVGITSAQAAERGDDDRRARPTTSAGNGKSADPADPGRGQGRRRGQGRPPVLGVHMVGARVGELIAEAQLIYNWEALPSEVAQLIHPHPTQSEVIGEAHLALAGKPLHAHADRDMLTSEPRHRVTTMPDNEGAPEAMSVSVPCPQLGESVTEGTVTRWLKKEGERVEADEPLLEVSTDKVDTEIPSPVSGILRGITVAEDETVDVGAELAVIDETGGEAAEAPAPAAEAAPAQAPPAAAPEYPQAAQEFAPPAQAPAVPAGPGRPAVPASPGRPGVPADPGRPGVPADPGRPGVPAGPGRPGVPAGPGRPGVPACGRTGRRGRSRVPARRRAGPARLCPAVDVHARRPGGTAESSCATPLRKLSQWAIQRFSPLLEAYRPSRRSCSSLRSLGFLPVRR